MPPTSAWCARLATKKVALGSPGTKTGRTERDVGQVSPAREGVVEDCDVAWIKRERVESGGYGHGHGAKMDRHVVAHRDDVTGVVEDCARVVTALFDVGRKGSSPEGLCPSLQRWSEARS